MSDEIDTAKNMGAGGLVVGTGGLLVWVLTKLFKPSEDLAIRQAKLEERVDNNKEKAEERINGIANTQSARLHALEITVAKLEEKISFLQGDEENKDE